MERQSQGVMVFCDDMRLVPGLLAKGRGIADQLGDELSAVFLGEKVVGDLEGLGRWGANTVYTVLHPLLSDFHVETAVDAFTEVISKIKPRIVLFAGTKRGLELMPRIAQRLGAGCLTQCVELLVDKDNQLVAVAMSYAGLGLTTYRWRREILLAGVDPNALPKVECPVHSVRVVALQANVKEPRMKVLERKARTAQGEGIEEARVVVDVGQGVKKKEDLEMVKTLAAVLGGKLGCTRPLSADLGWFPEWLGLSDKKVSPDLCIAIGVSGSIQHIVGIRGSRIVVAINQDEDAPVFFHADYGVVGNLYEIVPALIEEIRQRFHFSQAENSGYRQEVDLSSRAHCHEVGSGNENLD